jgi:hypothetical protein
MIHCTNVIAPKLIAANVNMGYRLLLKSLERPAE